jgi:hypothetical protein
MKKKYAKKIVAKIIMCGIICFISTGALFAKGAAQDETVYSNKEWVLCVTEFDVSGLPQARQVVGPLIAQYIVLNIKPADEKLRNLEEAEYYRQTAAYKSESEIAKKISAKQAERDKLVFQGLSNIQYKSSAKKIDAEIAALRKEYQAVEISPPKIALEPAFKMTDNNLERLFPPPPQPGLEYYFCNDQKADGFITGKISEFHDRYYVQLALWTMYARTYTYTDSVIFSIEDISAGVTELSDRLINEITGFRPAGIRVRTVPDNAVIVISEIFGGHGDFQISNFTPGEVKLSVYADNYDTIEETIELKEDQLVDVKVALMPTPTSDYTIDVSGDEKAVVYQGSLYKGETPISLNGPTDHYRDYYILTEDGKIAQSIFSISDQSLLLKPHLAPPEGRTNKARHRYYNSLGRFWITLPFFILSLGLYEKYTADAIRLRSYDVLDQAQIFQYAAIGFGALAGGFLIESFVKLGIYIWEGNRETSPLTAKQKATPLSSPSQTGSTETPNETEKTAEEIAEEITELIETMPDNGDALP